MKRFLILSLGLVVSASLGVAAGRYALAFTTSENVANRIFLEAGMSAPSDVTDPKQLESLAQSAEYPFQNLYLYMYQNVNKGPQEAALKILASEYVDGLQFNEDELSSIVLQGSTAPILDKLKAQLASAKDPSAVQAQKDAQAASDEAFQSYLSKNPGLSETSIAAITAAYKGRWQPRVVENPDTITATPSQAALLTTYSEIMDAYQTELNLQRDNRKWAYESLANEMFLNKDLSDSANIDLLYDLDLIHTILFGTTITYPDRSGGEPVDLASIDFEQAAPAPGEEDSVKLAEDTVSPFTCLDDAALHQALDVFEENGGNDAYAAPNDSDLEYPDPAEIAEKVVSESPEGSDTTNETTRVETATTAAEKVNDELENLSGFIDDLNGNKGDWTRSLPCGDVFCITIKLVQEADDPVKTGGFEETDDCIFCHVAYINQALTQTTDHSLVAGKVSTNWFEDATCKDAGNQVNLDINVYAVKKPIDLDPGDDIDDAPAEDVQNLKDALIHVGAFPQMSDVGKNRASEACKTLLNMNQIAGDVRSLQNVQEDCQTAADALANELAAVYDQSQLESLNSIQATLYQQVGAELYKMAVIFRNLQEGLQSTYLGEDAPLATLLAKKYCE